MQPMAGLSHGGISLASAMGCAAATPSSHGVSTPAATTAKTVSRMIQRGRKPALMGLTLSNSVIDANHDRPTSVTK